MQLPLLLPESNWKPPRLADLPVWAAAKRVAVDIETCDPKLRELGPGVRRGAYIVGYSFAIEDGPKYYIPLRHEGGDNVEDVEKGLGYLREQAKEFRGEIVVANGSYDYDFLLQEKIDFPNIKRFRDIQIAEPLIWEFAKSYSLETIAQKYLGIGKDEGMLQEAAVAFGVGAKKEMWKLPARFVGQYAEADAALPLLILRRQEKIIEEEELQKVFDLESDLLPVLVRMRRRGVRISHAKLDEVEQWSRNEERKCIGEVKRLTGYEIPFNSVWQATALVPALQHIGVKIPLTPKTKKPSIDKAFLASIKHPVADAINRARRVNKVRSTFVNSIREHAIGDRIHAVYHQLRSSEDDDNVESGEGKGARFGRLSSSNPNFQQQPARDPEIGHFWRSVFIPEEEEIWCSADFRSQEPSQAIHDAGTIKLGNIKVRTPTGQVWVDADKSARDMIERYKIDPKTDCHQELANIIEGRIATKPERDRAKIIFLALSYGMGGAKLCRSLGFPTIMAARDSLTGNIVEASTEEGKRLVSLGSRIYEAAGIEGQSLIDRFDASVPFVKALNKVCQKTANKYGYIRCEDGRKCRFPKDDAGNLLDSHKAMNKRIQGSSAGQTKAAMIQLDKEGFFMTAQIHDEICASVKDHAEAKKIGEIMENTYKLIVPSVVSLECGTSWGEAKEI